MSDELEYIKRVLKIVEDGDLYDSVRWLIRDGVVQFWVNCSDLFCWGTADGTDVTPDNIGVLEATVRDCAELEGSLKGVYPSIHVSDLFCARVSHMRPQGACYAHYPREMWPLFDACGPERETGYGNPCTPEQAWLLEQAKRGKGKEEARCTPGG